MLTGPRKRAADGLTDDEPTPEELAEIERRKAEVRESAEFRARHTPGDHRPGISVHFWEGGKSGNARRHGEPERPIVEDGPVVEEKMDASAPKSAPTKCPKCGTPYVNPAYRRCFRCFPAPAGKAAGCSTPKPDPEPKVKPDTLPVPVVPARIVPVESPALPPIGSAVAAIRGVVDLLGGLDDESARWVLESAFTLSRANRP